MQKFFWYSRFPFCGSIFIVYKESGAYYTDYKKISYGDLLIHFCFSIVSFCFRARNFHPSPRFYQILILIVFVRRRQFNRGTNCTPLGFQILIPTKHPLYILLWISTISQYFNDILHWKIPFFFRFVPNQTNLLAFEKFDLTHNSKYFVNI